MSEKSFLKSFENMLHNLKRCVYSRSIKRNKPPEQQQRKLIMRQQFEDYLNSLSKYSRRNHLTTFQGLDRRLSKSEEVKAVHSPLGEVYVLTDKNLYVANGKGLTTISPKSITSTNVHLNKAQVETSSEKIELRARSKGIIGTDMKSFMAFIDAIREVQNS